MGKTLLPSLFHGAFASQETNSDNSGNGAGSEGQNVVDSLVAAPIEAIVEDSPQYLKTIPQFFLKKSKYFSQTFTYQSWIILIFFQGVILDEHIFPDP